MTRKVFPSSVAVPVAEFDKETERRKFCLAFAYRRSASRFLGTGRRVLLIMHFMWSFVFSFYLLNWALVFKAAFFLFYIFPNQ